MSGIFRRIAACGHVAPAAPNIPPRHGIDEIDDRVAANEVGFSEFVSFNLWEVACHRPLLGSAWLAAGGAGLA